MHQENWAAYIEEMRATFEQYKATIRAERETSGFSSRKNLKKFF